MNGRPIGTGSTGGGEDEVTESGQWPVAGQSAPATASRDSHSDQTDPATSRLAQAVEVCTGHGVSSGSVGVTGGAADHPAGTGGSEVAAGTVGMPHRYQRRRLPARTRLAVSVGRFVSWLSRRTGYGSGGMIGGRVAMKLDPRALRLLAEGRTVVLVTGTNGKTTTTLMISRAIEALAPVASNRGGANMPGGALVALLDEPDAPYAVLEVDEGYLPWVAEQLRPAALVLLNLSRDQLDRVGEVRSTERELRAAVARLPETVVAANCDDVLVTSAAGEAAHPVWVSTAGRWSQDAISCPRCGQAVQHRAEGWHCSCGLSRPRPDWAVCGDEVVTPNGRRIGLALRLPGDANRANAALALATAASIGVPLGAAVSRMRGVTDVAGRYRTVRRSGHEVRLLLAKNPAGWAETVPLLDPDVPVVVAVNGREADGRDLSWLWDVPFERLRGRYVVASGERAADLAVRLSYAEVDHERQPDPLRAVDSLRAGRVELIANYTAFRDLLGVMGS